MKTESLIEGLSRDLAPVRRLPSPLARLGNWLALALPALAVVVAVEGTRPDLAERLTDPRFILTIALALATGLTAGWAALASTVPGLSPLPQAAPLVPASVWLASIGESCWRDWLRLGDAAWAGVATPQCFPEIIMAGTLPALALVWLARRGASPHPARTAALAALAAASLSAAALDLFHHSEAAIIALVWHFGAVMALTAFSALVGRRLFARL